MAARVRGVYVSRTYEQFQDALNARLLAFEAGGRNCDLIVLPQSDYEALAEIGRSNPYYNPYQSVLTFNGVEVAGSPLLTEPYFHPEQRP